MRGISNRFTFINTQFNAEGVHTNTAKEDQYVFLDAMFDAEYDVDILASAFNMDKAEFMGRRMLIDDWTTFDNERFSEIIADDQIEEVTADELSAMANVRAILVDREWFQFYDELMMFTEQYVASGIYWNYFLNVWKTVSYSPYSNGVVFMTGNGATAPASIDMRIVSKSENDGNIIMAVEEA